MVFSRFGGLKRVGLALLSCSLLLSTAQAVPDIVAGTTIPPKIQSKKRSQVRRAAAVEAVRYRKCKSAGVYCHVVSIDLSSPAIRLQAIRASDLGTRYRSFGSFVRRTRPLAAITGTFFDTATGSIICNLVREGKLVESGPFGHTLSLTDTNEPSWLKTAGSQGDAHNWRDSDFAVSSGPTLVRHGKVALNPRSEGFRDPGLFRKAARTGLATTRDNRLLMVSVNRGVTLRRFAQMMKGLGAENALNLDGGSSTALYARGRYLSKPSRLLTNVLVVSVRPGEPIPREVELEAEEAQLVPDEVGDVLDPEEFRGPAPEPAQVDFEADTIEP